MSTQLVDNFDLRKRAPLDARVIKQTVAEALQIHRLQRYVGLTVYIISLDKEYRFVGGVEDENFIEVESSGGYGVKYIKDIDCLEDIEFPVKAQSLFIIRNEFTLAGVVLKAQDSIIFKKDVASSSVLTSADFYVISNAVNGLKRTDLVAGTGITITETTDEKLVIATTTTGVLYEKVFTSSEFLGGFLDINANTHKCGREPIILFIQYKDTDNFWKDAVAAPYIDDDGNIKISATPFDGRIQITSSLQYAYDVGEKVTNILYGEV